MEAQNGTNRQAFRRCFPFLPAFSPAPSHPVGIGGTKKRTMGGDAPNAIRKTPSASQTGRTAMPAATAPMPRHQPPMGKGPRHRSRLRGKRGEAEGELERIRSAFGQRQAPCGRRFLRPWGKAGNTACRQKGNRTVRPPCKRGAFSPFPGRGAPTRPQGTEKGGREPRRSSPAFCPPLSGAARPLSRPRPGHKIMTKVPAVISTPPRAVFRVIFSCKKTKASTIVMTTLNLSMGTTRETSPIWMAL